MTAERRFLHDHKARALKVAHNALRSDSGHVLIGLMNTLAAFEPQGQGDSISEVARVGWRELVVGVGHLRTIARQ